MSATTIHAVHLAAPVARLRGARPLHFHDDVDPAHGLAAHVQAGSAVRYWNGSLVVVQDDVAALAVLDDPGGARARPLLLPAGHGGARVFGEHLGNKAHKFDLEAAAVLPDGRLVAFGSGSTERRQQLVVLHPAGDVQVVDGAGLYAMLRGTVAFAGAELNIEGAVCSGGELWLFQRGNGAAVDGLEAIDAVATIEVDAFVGWLDGGGPLPTLKGVRRFDLGSVAGVPLTFTDAAALPDGRLAFLAVAEDSPDTYHDGEVSGCRLGVWDPERGDARTVTVLDEAGTPLLLKLEGLDVLPPAMSAAMAGTVPGGMAGAVPGGMAGAGDGRWRFVVVADMDDHTVPATMGVLEVDPF